MDFQLIDEHFFVALIVCKRRHYRDVICQTDGTERFAVAGARTDGNVVCEMRSSRCRSTIADKENGVTGLSGRKQQIGEHPTASQSTESKQLER